MATIPRGLVVASRTPRRDVTHARQWVSAGLALIAVAALAVPFKQTDWPAAKPPKNLPPPALVLAGSLPLTTFRTLPFSAKDWPIPQRVNESSIARKWERANDLPRQLQQTLPFSVTDWPLAERRSALAPETPPFNLVPQVGPTPFAFFDWSLAKKISLRAPDTPPISSVPQVGPTPFASYDWPLAEKPRPSAPEASPLNTAAIRTVVSATKPFAALDWPLAKRRLRTLVTSSPDRPGNGDPAPVTDITVTSGVFEIVGSTLTVIEPSDAIEITSGVYEIVGSLLTVTDSSAPFAQLDWPLAKRSRPVPPVTPPISMVPTVGPRPFAFFDWSLAKRPRPSAPETSPLNTAAFRTIVVAAPFASFDWPLTRRVDSPVARRWERANDLPRQLQVTLPFAALDWPLAKRPLPAPEPVPLNVAAIRTAVAAGAPFAFFGWDQAKRPLRVAPETPLPTSLGIRTVVVVTKPFALLDWPLAKKRIGTAEEPPPNTTVATPPPPPTTGTFAATLADVTLVGVSGPVAPSGERVSHNNSGTGGFAVGRHALGTCDMCAGVYLLRELRPEIYNLRPTGFLVCDECWDLDNPQLQVGRVPIFDPEALRNPRTDTHRAESRELWGFNPVGNQSTNVRCQDGTVSVNDLFQFPNREVTP